MSLDSTTTKTVEDMVFEYFSQECAIPKAQLTTDSNIIEDLDGDSLMLLALLEMVRKKFQIGIELKTLGKHLMKKPAHTIGDIIALSLAVVEHGDNIVNVDL